MYAHIMIYDVGVHMFFVMCDVKVHRYVTTCNAHISYDMWCESTHIHYNMRCESIYMCYNMWHESTCIYIITCGVGVHEYITIMHNVRVHIFIMIWCIQVHEFALIPNVYISISNYFEVKFYLFIMYILCCRVILAKRVIG